MSPQDPRREILKNLELLEEEIALKMNRDFSTFADVLISNMRLMQVYSEAIKKSENIEKAYDIIMCILPQLGDDDELLQMFDWFLTQTKDFNEDVSKLNICIPFKTEYLFNKQSYEPCQFPITLHSRASIKELT
jgi:hypothetical protein